MQVKVVNVESNTFSIAYIFEGRFDEAININLKLTFFVP
jgi:hypothetical protein